MRQTYCRWIRFTSWAISSLADSKQIRSCCITSAVHYIANSDGTIYDSDRLRKGGFYPERACGGVELGQSGDGRGDLGPQVVGCEDFGVGAQSE